MKNYNINDKELPIGFMDSGLGGISVMKEAVKIMPSEDFLYYGDSANAPYGEKDRETIRQLTFSVVEKLLEKGIKGLAVACNTATSAAVATLREMYPELPLVGIEPAIKPAVKANHGGKILVMATPMTIAQEKFQKLLKQYIAECENEDTIIPISCPGMMELVEHDNLEGSLVCKYLNEHLKPYLSEDVETIVLGCTHYPFLRPYLHKFLGAASKIQIIDGSRGTALELKRRLGEKNMLKACEKAGTITFINSSDDPAMLPLCRKLFEMPIE